LHLNSAQCSRKRSLGTSQLVYILPLPPSPVMSPAQLAVALPRTVCTCVCANWMLNKCLHYIGTYWVVCSIHATCGADVYYGQVIFFFSTSLHYFLRTDIESFDISTVRTPTSNSFVLPVLFTGGEMKKKTNRRTASAECRQHRAPGSLKERGKRRTGSTTCAVGPR
jgi:hypothetical protein